MQLTNAILCFMASFTAGATVTYLLAFYRSNSFLRKCKKELDTCERTRKKWEQLMKDTLQLKTDLTNDKRKLVRQGIRMHLDNVCRAINDIERQGVYVDPENPDTLH